MKPRLLASALALTALSARCTSPTQPPSDVATVDTQVTDLGGPDASAPDVSPPDAFDVAVVDVVNDVVDAAPDVSPPDASAPDAGPPDAAPPDAPLQPTFCSLGVDVPGLTVPAGFCLREFISSPSTSGTPGLNPRAMVFAPNGDLFVSSPSTFAPGGSGGGHGAVLLLADDDHDGRADGIVTFAEGLLLSSVHGLALGGGYLYFTVERSVFRTPYTAGQRSETGTRENLNVDSTFPTMRWTHGLARSVGGQLYASRGEHTAVCAATPIGAVMSVGSGGVLTPVADGLRNPMYVRCHYRDELCMATELGEDGSSPNGREKLIPIDTMHRNFGYPGCYRVDTAAACGHPDAGVSCASPAVAGEVFSWPIESTPFGLDWEHDQWPAPYTGGLFVALHGSFYNPYQGAGVVFVPTNATTHQPTGDAQQMFVQGFGNPSTRNERPSEVTFAPDGRLFFSVDTGNKIYWIAPTTLRMPAR